MQKHRAELEKITTILLKQEDDYAEIKKASDDLYMLFLSVSDLQEEEEYFRQDIFLPKGKAIGTVWAGLCVKEMMRTKRFIRGIYKGIKKAQKIFSEEPIHIVYAGTGPFGALLLPLTSVFTSREIQITLLEVNPQTIQILQKVIQALQVEEYIKEIIQCDAAEYQGPLSKPIHMVVSETMQNALYKEPQVAVTLNLFPQMEEEGIFIPQNIMIEAGLLDSKRDMERMMGVESAEQDFYYPLGRVFELNKMSLSKIFSISENQEKAWCFSEVEIEIPNNMEARYKRVCLFTTIQVFEEEQLTYAQCSLTMPKKLMYIDHVSNPISRMCFQYVLNEQPGFKFEVEK